MSTKQQNQLEVEAKALLETIDEVVPRTTAHFAVERARIALRALVYYAHDVKTNDVGVADDEDWG